MIAVALEVTSLIRGFELIHFLQKVCHFFKCDVIVDCT